MAREDNSRAWMVLGGLGAMALGVALIPLRTVTSASNLAFVFMAFTIVVAEVGGRVPALVAALVSAMTLNFFLTEPYLTLSISKTDDVIAFAALAACGLIAAAFGTRRERSAEAAGRAAQELELLRRLVEQVRSGADVPGMLGDLRQAFGLRALVLRDASGAVLAAAPPEAAATAVPVAELTREWPFPSDETHHRFGARGLRLPEGGGRLDLETERGPFSLSLWEGDAEGLDLDQWRTLSIAVAILGLRFSRSTDA